MSTHIIEINESTNNQTKHVNKDDIIEIKISNNDNFIAITSEGRVFKNEPIIQSLQSKTTNSTKNTLNFNFDNKKMKDIYYLY